MDAAETPPGRLTRGQNGSLETRRFAVVLQIGGAEHRRILLRDAIKDADADDDGPDASDLGPQGQMQSVVFAESHF